MGLFGNILGKNKKNVKILAIDTSSSVCSVALLEGNTVIDERNMNNGLTHSENLMPLVDQLLKANEVELKDINVIGVCIGPGSFTGIRIGIASILPMAEFNNIKVAPVSSLQVLARNVDINAEFENEMFSQNMGQPLYNIETFKSITNQIKEYSEKITQTTIIPILDARNDLVYTGVYDTIYKKQCEELSCTIDEAIEIYNKYDNIVFVGDGAVKHEEKIKSSMQNKTIKFAENNSQFASNVGKAAYEMYLDNSLRQPNEIQPLYLRKSQAERLKKE